MRIPVAVVITLLSAVPAMAIDFTRPMTTLDGKPFKDPSGQITDVTLAVIAENALLQAYSDETNLSGEDKIKRYTLARKIADNPKTELSAEEIALLKKLIAKSYNPLITGQSWKMLDPASVPK